MEVGDSIRELDYVILGGGILGTALAALASEAGRQVLVVRLSDETVPMSDTLRNQGWLQSGLMFSRSSRYNSEEDYKISVRSAFLQGARLLKMCRMQPSTDRGILKVKDQTRIEEIRYKAKLLRLQDGQFRELSFQEARDKVGVFADQDSKYFIIPDTPFDEAGVMTHLRSIAIERGALFWDLSEPAKIAIHNNQLQIKCGEEVVDSPLTFIAAGAGTVQLFECISSDNHPFDLQHTPLMVHNGSSDETASVFVDLDRGFSSVRHELNDSGKFAFVTGTRANYRDAKRNPYQRGIRATEIAKFRESVHPAIESQINEARFTGGCELIHRSHPIVQHWLKDVGNIVFGSPGRATMALAAAEDAYLKMEGKLNKPHASSFAYAPHGRTAWDAPIRMHFVPPYSFNDAD